MVIKFWDILPAYLQATILTISVCVGLAGFVILIAAHPMILVLAALGLGALVPVTIIFASCYDFATNRKRQLRYSPKRNGK